MKKRSFLLRVITIMLLLGVIVWGYARQFVHTPWKTEEAVNADVSGDKQETEDAGTPTNDDPFKEMDQLVNAYYNGGYIQLKGNVKLIDDNTEVEKTIGQYAFSYQYANGDFYYKLDSMEFAAAGGRLLVVDHRAKAMSLAYMADAKKNPALFNIGDFRKMVEDQEAKAKVTEADGMKMLSVENIQDPQIQAYRIYYDPVNYMISKVLIAMVRLEPLEEKDETTEDAFTYSYYMELSYTTRENARIPVSDIVARFLIKEGDNNVLKPAYSSYDLNDFTRQPASSNQEMPVSE